MANLKLIFMDAGQGDATLVVYPDDSLMLIDCGSTKNKALVTGEIIKVLRKYLPKTPNGKTIKTLVLTHPDADHYNIIGDVTREFGLEYQQVIFGGEEKEYRAPVGGSGGLLSTIPHMAHICLQNNAFDPTRKPNVDLTRSDVKGWVLAANYPNKSHAQKNDKSIVLLLEYQGVKVFLMGDAVDKTEEMILKRYKGAILDPPDTGRVALKVGHHGSPTSSSEAWIKTIKPQILFISSDTRNFHIPKLSLINRITKNTTLHAGAKHDYVYYDDVNAPPGFKLEKQKTEAIYTTLYNLTPETGGSYYYTIKDDGSINVSRTD